MNPRTSPIPTHERMRDLLVEYAADEPRRAARTARTRVIAAGAAFAVVAACGVGALAFAGAPQPVTELAAPAATASPGATPASTPIPVVTTSPGAGAGGAPTSGSTAAPAAGQATALPDPGILPVTPTIEEFQAAVTAAGFDCSSWQPLLEGPPGMTAGGTCLPSELTLTLFVGAADVDRVLALNDASLETARLLTGPNWIVSLSDVTGMSDDLIALQPHLGGTLTW